MPTTTFSTAGENRARGATDARGVPSRSTLGEREILVSPSKTSLFDVERGINACGESVAASLGWWKRLTLPALKGVARSLGVPSRMLRDTSSPGVEPRKRVTRTAVRGDERNGDTRGGLFLGATLNGRGA